MPLDTSEQVETKYDTSKDASASVAREAAAASQNERNMGLRESLQTYRKACLWSVVVSACIIMEGFSVLLLHNLYAYPPFQQKFGELLPDGKYELTAAWQSGLANGALCGQIIGLVLNGYVADRFGYRKVLLGALSACVAFVFIIFFAENLVQLLIGEILIGIPWGVFQTLATVYAAEVCPTHLRAYLMTYVNLCWVLGQFIASGVLRAMVSHYDSQWGYKIPFALKWIWPLPLMVGIWMAPESPWWLIRQDRVEMAQVALRRLTSRTSDVAFEVDETISMMVHTNEQEKQAQEGTTYMDIFKGTNRRRTEIVCMTWMIQILCGTAFMGYSTYFYRQAGMDVKNSFTMTLVQYAIGAVGTLLSWFLMGWFGRRTLYLYGQYLMGISLLAIGCCSFAGRQNVAAQWAIGSLLLAYTFAYDCTVGPVCYSLVAELTSTRLRVKSVVLARTMYNIIGLVSNVVTPFMLNPSAWNWGAKAGFFWAATTFCCSVWTFFRLPEPKGRTYAELNILFERRVSARKFSSTAVTVLEGECDEIGVPLEGLTSSQDVAKV